MLPTLIVVDGDNIFIPLEWVGKRLNPEILLSCLAGQGATNIVGAHFFRTNRVGVEEFERAGFTTHRGPLSSQTHSIPDWAMHRVIRHSLPDFDRLVLASNDGDFNGICRFLRKREKEVWRVSCGDLNKRARSCCDHLLRLETLAKSAPGLIYDIQRNKKRHPR